MMESLKTRNTKDKGNVWEKYIRLGRLSLDSETDIERERLDTGRERDERQTDREMWKDKQIQRQKDRDRWGQNRIEYRYRDRDKRNKKTRTTEERYWAESSSYSR